MITSNRTTMEQGHQPHKILLNERDLRIYHIKIFFEKQFNYVGHKKSSNKFVATCKICTELAKSRLYTFDLCSFKPNGNRHYQITTLISSKTLRTLICTRVLIPRFLHFLQYNKFVFIFCEQLSHKDVPLETKTANHTVKEFFASPNLDIRMLTHFSLGLPPIYLT